MPSDMEYTHTLKERSVVRRIEHLPNVVSPTGSPFSPEGTQEISHQALVEDRK